MEDEVEPRFPDYYSRVRLRCRAIALHASVQITEEPMGGHAESLRSGLRSRIHLLESL